MPCDIAIEHIGSTAVKGALGKGIIDILIMPSHLTDVQRVRSALGSIGFSHVPEKGSEERIFMAYPLENTSYGDLHVHICPPASDEARDLVRFRDALRKDKALVTEYNNLKKDIAERVLDRDGYTQQKASFIRRVIDENQSQPL